MQTRGRADRDISVLSNDHITCRFMNKEVNILNGRAIGISRSMLSAPGESASLGKVVGSYNYSHRLMVIVFDCIHDYSLESHE
jgi:hypothetical protein